MRRPVPRGRGPALQDLRTDGDPLGLSGTIIRIDPTTGEGLAANPLGDSPDPNARRIVAGASATRSGSPSAPARTRSGWAT